MIRHAIIIALALPCVAFPLPLTAQSSEPVTIEEIQVMAIRRPTDLRKESAALSIISSDGIRGVKLTTDALEAQTRVYL